MSGSPVALNALNALGASGLRSAGPRSPGGSLQVSAPHTFASILHDGVGSAHNPEPQRGAIQSGGGQNPGQAVAEGGKKSPRSGSGKGENPTADPPQTGSGEEGKGQAEGVPSTEPSQTAKAQKGGAERRKSSRQDNEGAAQSVTAAAVVPLPGDVPPVPSEGGGGTAATVQEAAGRLVGAAATVSTPADGARRAPTAADGEPTAKGDDDSDAGGKPALEDLSGALNGARSRGAVAQGAQTKGDKVDSIRVLRDGPNGTRLPGTMRGNAAAGPAVSHPTGGVTVDGTDGVRLHGHAGAVQLTPSGASSAPGGTSHRAADAGSLASGGAAAAILNQLAGPGHGTPDGQQAPIDPRLAGAASGTTASVSHFAAAIALPSGLYHTNLSVNASSWPDDLGNQVIWMVSQNVSTADLTLSPPDLGKMQIRISLEDDTTKVSFSVHNVAARQTVEGTLPRLRELCQQVGVNLQHVDVTEHHSSANQGRSGSGFEHADRSGGHDQSGASIEIQSLSGARSWVPSDGVIDAYV